MATDNNTTDKFIKNNMTQKKSKSWELLYHWLREQHNKNRFKFHWKKSSENLTDFHSWRVSTTYHKNIRSRYMSQSFNILTCSQVAMVC